MDPRSSNTCCSIINCIKKSFNTVSTPTPPAPNPVVSSLGSGLPPPGKAFDKKCLSWVGKGGARKKEKEPGKEGTLSH